MTAPGQGQAAPADPPAPADEPPGEGGQLPGTGQRPPGAAGGAIDTGIGGSPVRPAGVVLLAFLILAALVFFVYCLIAVWPTGAASTATPSHVLGLRLMLGSHRHGRHRTRGTPTAGNPAVVCPVPP
jgi:hypothetical protein